MNRRGFLSALALAPVAIMVAPAVAARHASGGVIRASSFAALQTISPAVGTVAVVGEIGPELILPINPARAMQQIFEAAYGVDEANTVIFDVNAAYCDELVEAPVD